jgi:hypothetical protein
MSDDHVGQQRPGVPRGGTARRGAHACQGRRRAGGRAGVLCCGDARDAKLDGWGEWVGGLGSGYRSSVSALQRAVKSDPKQAF